MTGSCRMDLQPARCATARVGMAMRVEGDDYLEITPEGGGGVIRVDLDEVDFLFEKNRVSVINMFYGQPFDAMNLCRCESGDDWDAMVGKLRQLPGFVETPGGRPQRGSSGGDG